MLAKQGIPTMASVTKEIIAGFNREYPELVEAWQAGNAQEYMRNRIPKDLIIQSPIMQQKGGETVLASNVRPYNLVHLWAALCPFNEKAINLLNFLISGTGKRANIIMAEGGDNPLHVLCQRINEITIEPKPPSRHSNPAPAAQQNKEQPKKRSKSAPLSSSTNNDVIPEQEVMNTFRIFLNAFTASGGDIMSPNKHNLMFCEILTNNSIKTNILTTVANFITPGFTKNQVLLTTEKLEYRPQPRGCCQIM
jgi:hypothetical protein